MPSDPAREEPPLRVQLSRAKGWRMPPNTVKVDRTTRWGNPIVETDQRSREECAHLCRAALLGVEIRPAEMALRRYVAFVTAHIGDLKGKNLACWCALDAACHADTLLELANPQKSGRGRIRRAGVPRKHPGVREDNSRKVK